MGLFSRYAHPIEKDIERYLKGVSEKSSRQAVHDRLVTFLQTNTVVVNLWLEKRFKNYRYLNATKRQQLYENSEALVRAFHQFEQSFKPSPEKIQQAFFQAGIPYPVEFDEQITYMSTIMSFLKPGGIYQYIESATFGKLLQDPAHNVLTGDCNQIVTLYVFLYAQRYPVTDLQIKILPDHVCLYMQGIDIEATNGQFMHYDKYEYVAPISELVSVNLLDISDFRENTAKLSGKSLLKSAQLATAVSSMRELVQRNLRVAYHNLALSSIQNRNMTLALEYAKKANVSDLYNYVYHEIVTAAVKANNYRRASYYADKSQNRDLRRYVKSSQAAYLYNKNRFKDARRIYSQLNDQQMVKATYAGEYNALVRSVQNLKTIDQMKRKKSTYRKLQQLAQKGGMRDTARSLQDLIQKL